MACEPDGGRIFQQSVRRQINRWMSDEGNTIEPLGNSASIVNECWNSLLASTDFCWTGSCVIGDVL
ncbi:MAG: hypothetical protein ACI92S_004387, partial [Planctomycetaceae bacterium]